MAVCNGALFLYVVFLALAFFAFKKSFPSKLARLF